ncbi:MAG: hypothetical protein R3C14_47440 [Caldilineaceae bacterium]
MYFSQQQAARERYGRHVWKARLADWWGWLVDSETDLVRFEEVAGRLHARQQLPRGIQSVPLRQIIGSVGRAHDFTRTFLPRPRVDVERWAKLDTMINGLASLPPVDLYQIGEVYFVQDGHHRISVAHANGLCEIEADVIELKSPIALKVEDFQRGRWMKIAENFEKEQAMYPVLDSELARKAYEERLREAAHERRCQQLARQQPRLQTRLRQSLANWLITFGTRLKTQYQS